MLLIITGIFIILGVIEAHDTKGEDTIHGMGFIAVVLVILCLWNWGGYITKSQDITQSITFLEQHNQSIDTEVQEIVAGYMGFEEEVLKKENASMIVLVEKYPDLKSNQLVNRQLDVYLANRDEIKTKNLKLIKLNAKMRLWKVW